MGDSFSVSMETSDEDTFCLLALILRGLAGHEKSKVKYS